jgi:hypothetical protein
VPEGLREVRVEFEIADTWAAFGWFPQVHLYAPDGSIAASADGPGRIELVALAKPNQSGQLWSIGPISRVSAPRGNESWNKPMRPPDQHFPSWFKLADNLPQFVSTRPDLFFVPESEGSSDR